MKYIKKIILENFQSHKYSVIELSKTVLNHIEKLQDLKLITVNELMKIPGIKMF